ncbi:SDR family oxidoreductase [Luteimonas sp. SDU82]|uniref:SDR family oxidoreductase n=1 Tax=Luteimonas sp. SDU82 TaxID=3422592 RepID=UPI003EB91BD3
MVLGGGLVGAALVDALAARGHRTALARRGTREHAGTAVLAWDFNALPDERTLADALAGVDVLVNTVGIFREAAEQSFDAIHVKGPRQLFEAACRAGVARIVQLSALGADPASSLPYFASKGQAEQILRGLPVQGAIVRPSLVFAPAGASTRWFAQLASLPLLPLPGGGRQRIQPVHLDDLVEALVRLVEADRVPQSLDAVGPRALTLVEYLGLFRRGMGLRGRTVSVPSFAARGAAWLAASFWPRVPLDPDALAMLDAGNTADPGPLTRWLGRPPRAPESFIGPHAGAIMRWPALLSWTVPAMRWTVAAMWIATGIVSLWLYPRELSLDMLAQVGLRGPLADAALWSAALLDIALGVALLHARWRAPAYLAQLLLVLGYTVIISIWLPGQWLHPFGPVLKNLPLLAMILALLALDRKPWT